MEDSLLLSETHGAVTVLTLNRPEKRNAVNRALGALLVSALQRLDADDSVRVIVLTGAGSHAFCAGADMGELLDDPIRAPSAEAKEQQPRALSANVLHTIAKPVIAAVNGFAFGLGAQLAVSADIRIASTSARFRFVGTSYGLVVSGADLPRAVGAAMAKELLFTARVVDAAEAGRIGLANHVVAPADLMPKTLDMAEQIAANSPQAVRWAKRVVNAATVLEAAAGAEAEAHRALAGTADNATRFTAAAKRVTGRS
jgi:enoyl-CoA hydratase/carnithine racemase